jgi:hypothetical protein
MTTAHDTVAGAHLPAIIVTTLWGFAWTAVFVGFYANIRRDRA